MTFEGVAVLALLAMVVVTAVVRVPRPPGRVGLAGAGWLVGVVATAALHRSFERAGGY